MLYNNKLHTFCDIVVRVRRHIVDNVYVQLDIYYVDVRTCSKA